MWCEVLEFVFLFLNVLVSCSDYLDVKVNGNNLDVKVAKVINGVSYLGHYEYFYGESVTFSCHKSHVGRNFTGVVLLDIFTNTFGYFSSVPRVCTYNETKSLYVKLTTEHNDRYVECSITKYGGNKTLVSRIHLKESSGKPASKPTELEYVPNYLWSKNVTAVPVIEGLYTERILAMYYRDSSTFIVLYEYEYDEEIVIHCKTNVHEPVWKFNVSKVQNLQNDTVAGAVPFKKSGKFVMKADEDSAAIYCFKTKKLQNESPFTEIMLVRKKNKQDLISPANSLVTTSSGVNKGVLVGAIVGVIILIVVIAFTTYKLFKKTPKPPAVESTISYTNLSEQNKPNENIEDQQQKIQYAVPILPPKPVQNEIYANIGPNNNKTMPDDRKDGNAPIEAVNPTYAEAVPKHLRSLDRPENPVTYAKLALKPAVPKKPIKMHTENPYAEISKNKDTLKDSNIED